MPDRAIAARLKATPAINGMIAGRIYSNGAESNKFPSITLEVSEQEQGYLSDKPRVGHYDITVRIMAADALTAKNLRKLIKIAMDKQTFSTTGVIIRACNYLTSEEQSVLDDANNRIHEIALTFGVWALLK